MEWRGKNVNDDRNDDEREMNGRNGRRQKRNREREGEEMRQKRTCQGFKAQGGENRGSHSEPKRGDIMYGSRVTAAADAPFPDSPNKTLLRLLLRIDACL